MKIKFHDMKLSKSTSSLQNHVRDDVENASNNTTTLFEVIRHILQMNKKNKEDLDACKTKLQQIKDTNTFDVEEMINALFHNVSLEKKNDYKKAISLMKYKLDTLLQ